MSHRAEYARERSARGLCCSCSELAIPGTARCPKHTEISRQRYHTKVTGDTDATAYELLKANGICVACKKSPADANSVYCQTCLQRQRQRQFRAAALRKNVKEETNAALIVKRKAEGVCVDCDAVDVFENDRCRFCQAAWLRRHEHLTIYDSRLRVGLCQCCPTIVIPGTVRCSACQVKRIDKMTKRQANKICRSCPLPTDGKHKHCDSCRAARKSDYARRKAAGICVAPSCTLPNDGETLMCVKHRQADIEKNARKQLKLRNEVIAAYGGKCACPGCPETLPEFLSVDHIAGDGAEHRRAVKLFGGVGFYRWLKKYGFPKANFQLLCTNCNSAKHRYGECPHIAAARTKQVN